MLVVSVNWLSTSKLSNKLMPPAVEVDEEVEALELVSESDFESGSEASN